MKVPVNEFDGKVTYGQKRRNTGTDQGLSQIHRLNKGKSALLIKAFHEIDLNIFIKAFCLHSRK